MKEFLKNISIYGILPVIGKFVGFFLIPIYVRVFSSYEFGIVELIVQLASFIMFACNLEFYTAIGRFFYERKEIDDRRRLISTGLVLTLFFTVIVISLAFFIKDSVIRYYLDNGNYHKEYLVSLVWLFFSAIYTYLGIIPRYDKRPKLYVLITVSSLLIRVGSTILYVLFLKVGIIGVIYGHITGSIASTILNIIASWKYIGFCFNWKDAKAIIKFSIPIVPGLLIVGFWHPLSRNLVSKYFSIETVGLLSFAVRITSVMTIINGAIHLAWGPMLFENHKKPSFNKDVFRISMLSAIILFYGAIFLTLLAPEICLYIGTAEYVDSAVLIGFLSFNGILEILGRLRGFGPLILKKTYLLTIIEIIGFSVGVAALIILKDRFGLVGIGFAFLIPKLLRYFLLVPYTASKLNLEFHSIQELFLLLILIISINMVCFSLDLIPRVMILTSVSIYLAYLLMKNKTRYTGAAH